MALVTGAIVLLAALVLNVNRSLLKSTDQTIQAEAIIAGTSVAQQVIDIISSKAFDEATIDTVIESENDFTSPAYLGPDGSEVASNYDDIDDYDGFVGVINTPRMGPDTARVTVRYVNPTSPGSTSNVRTRMKRIDVRVISPYLPDTLKMFYYSSY